METSGNPDDETGLSNFPRSPSQFDDDPRISFSKLDNRYILETEDGAEFEYDSALKRWVASVGFHASRFPPALPPYIHAGLSMETQPLL